MFTGLIEDVGVLRERRPAGKAAKLHVETRLPAAEIRIGDSIAVNGACLTAEAVREGLLIFHALNETLRKTNLADARPGAPVNLERAMRLGDRLGGHLVAGHVDTTAPILDIGRRDEDYAVTIALPDTLKALVIPKGSIAVNGISLTVAELREDLFTVCIIPHTWQATNLADAHPGDRVNLEADMIGKYILRYREVSAAGSVSMDSLARAGFTG